jgi:uncharacterized protein YaaN involved in tellurite resistance
MSDAIQTEGTVADPTAGVPAVKTLDPVKLKFTEKELALVQSKVLSIDPRDTASLITYGQSSITKLNNLVEPVLKTVQTCKSGAVGPILTDLKNEIRNLDVLSLPKQEDKGLLGKIFGDMFSKIRGFIEQYESVQRKIDDLSSKLFSASNTALENISRLDKLDEINQESIREFEIEIAALEQKSSEIKKDLDKVKLEADANPADADLAEETSRLNSWHMSMMRRIYNLHLARTDAKIMGPQLRLAKEASVSIVDLCGNAQNFIIPKFKKNVFMAIALYDTKSAAKLIQKAKEANEELTRLNAELLQEGVVSTKTLQQEGFIGVQTLVEVTDKLIKTIDQGIEIDRASLKKWSDSEKALAELEGKIADAERKTASSNI